VDRPRRTPSPLRRSAAVCDALRRQNEEILRGLVMDASTKENDANGPAPGPAGPKRKSGLISSPCRNNAAAPPSSSSGGGNSGAGRPGPGLRWRPPPPPVEATDDRRANVADLSSWLARESRRKANAHASTSRRGPTPPSAYPSSPAPIKFAPRVRREDVEATSDARTSVVELSRWLDDDPLNRRRVRTVRTGGRVIARSRAYESAGRADVAEVCGGGNVAGRAEWLSGAFGQQGDGGRAAARPPRPSAEDGKRPHQKGEEGPGVEPGSVGEKKDRPPGAFGGDATGRGVRAVPPRPSGGAGSADADTGGARRPGQEREGGVGPYRREDPAPGGDDGEGGGGATSVTERRAWLSGAFGGGDTAGGTGSTAGGRRPGRAEVAGRTSGPSDPAGRTSAAPPGTGYAGEEKASVADRAEWLRGAFSQ